MKWVQTLLLGLLLFLGVTATAQRRQNPAPELRQRMNELKLTDEQKRRIAIIIRRQRLQNVMNQRELNDVLTEKQKLLLTRWREKQENRSDSAVVKH